MGKSHRLIVGENSVGNLPAFPSPGARVLVPLRRRTESVTREAPDMATARSCKKHWPGVSRNPFNNYKGTCRHITQTVGFVWRKINKTPFHFASSFAQTSFSCRSLHHAPWLENRVEFSPQTCRPAPTCALPAEPPPPPPPALLSSGASAQLTDARRHAAPGGGRKLLQHFL